MSSYSSRPNVKEVDRALVDAAIGGTVLIGSLIFSGVKALARAAANTLQMPSSGVILPAAAIRPEVRTKEAIKISNTSSRLDRDRLEALNLLAQQPLRVSNTAAIMAHVDKVLNSVNSAQLSLSMRVLREAVTTENDSLFASGVARTCEAAMKKIGLGQVTAGLSSSGTLRVVGSDDAGRTLVSEITVKPGSLPTLETETVNVLDGSCTDILNRFERAVEELGLRSGDPKRRVTGGFCQTAAGKALIRTKFARRFHKREGQVDGSSITASVAKEQQMSLTGGGRRK